MSGRGTLIGSAGEDAAVDWLRAEGFYICERNWRAGRYEIDIIALRWNEVHFVEVKTRRSSGWIAPEQAVDAAKIRALRRAATAYMARRHMRQYEIRFDLIAVETRDDGVRELRYVADII
ncbi:MAG: YraN family protein [Alistipes sp.]|nr:YraN family protein [Alistipes sp.]MDE7129455.1 YraN family protein [Alistipes sp.]